MKKEKKDRVYILKRGGTPPSYTIQSRNSTRKPLLYWDEEKNTNRALRYAKNQKTPFEDEQDGFAIVEPVTFYDGLLTVPKTNPVLQEFLAKHPGYGVEFIEKDNERNASDELAKMTSSLDAQTLVRDSDINLLIPVAKILLGVSTVDRLKTTEIRRDMMIYAKESPEELLDLMNDPEVAVKNVSVQAIHDGLIQFRPSKRELYYNLKDNKKKLMSVPFDETPEASLSSFLMSPDGVDLMKYLEKEINK